MEGSEIIMEESEVNMELNDLYSFSSINDSGSSSSFGSLDQISFYEANECLKEDYLDVPVAAKVFYTVSLSLTFVISGFGDSLLCFLIFRHKRLRSVTNLLIANLAISDVLVALLCVPLNLHYNLSGMDWIWGSFACSFIGGLKNISMFVSVNTLLVIAIDRFIGIFWPLRPRIKKRTLLFIVIAIWVTSTLVGLPTPIRITLTTGMYNGKIHNFCFESWQPKFGKLYISFITIFEFLLPLFVMGSIYILIAQQLWFHRTLPGNQTDRNREISLIRKRKTIPMLITVVVAFFICWSPYYAYNLLYHFHHDNLACYDKQVVLTFIVESIAMLNSVISTIIYLFMSPTFRAELINIHKSIAYGHFCDCRSTDELSKGRYQVPSRTGSNFSNSKNGSLHAHRKSSHETAEARL